MSPSPYRTDILPRDAPFRRSGCGLLSLSLLAGLFFVAAFVVLRPAVDRQRLAKVRQGMDRSEVVELLGPPQSGEGSNQWDYWRPGNAGWASVAFDREGHVLHTNDESVFPPGWFGTDNLDVAPE